MAWWPLALAAVVLGLALLALAETVWLPRSMPREHVARASVVLLAGDRDWAEGEALALEQATAAGLLEDIARRLGPEGAQLSHGQLRESMRASVQCVQVADAGGQWVRGVLVSATVRGRSSAEVSAIADAWSEALRASPQGMEGLVAAPGTPYLPCGERP